MKKSLLIILVVFLLSCSTQRQLTKTFYGKSVADLKEHFGNPKTVFDRGEEKIYVFENIKELRSTEINQAQLTLDPMITPQVKKTERFYFTIKEGKVYKAKLEEEYER